jgi:hypothetical protein
MHHKTWAPALSSSHCVVRYIELCVLPLPAGIQHSESAAPGLPAGTESHSTLTHRPAAPCLQENPDLFKWLTGQLQAPEHMLGNPAFVVSGATCLLLLTTIMARDVHARNVRSP